MKKGPEEETNINNIKVNIMIIIKRSLYLKMISSTLGMQISQWRRKLLTNEEAGRWD
jgi:hypothetical protein